MKVAYVNADCGIPIFGEKGAAIHIREMVTALQTHGVEVKLLSSRVGHIPNEHWRNIVEHVVPDYDCAKRFDPSVREQKERSYIEIANAIENRLLELYKAWPFELIYERYSLWSAASVRASKKLDVPVVLEVNAPLIIEQQQFREIRLLDEAVEIEKEVFSHADVITPVSETLANYVTEKSGRSDNIIVLGNAVDTKRFHPDVKHCRNSLGYNQNHFVIGFTGSLKNWHGIDTLLRSFASVQASSENMRLLIVGDGPKRGWVEGFIDGLGLSDKVTITGWIGHDKLPELLASMDVVTAPYPPIEDSYFSPLKLFEYLGIGKPIISSDIGQIGTIIEHRKSGLLVKPGSQESLSNAIFELKTDPQLAKRIANNAAKLGTHHSWESNARVVLDAFQTVKKAA